MINFTALLYILLILAKRVFHYILVFKLVTLFRQNVVYIVEIKENRCDFQSTARQISFSNISTTTGPVLFSALSYQQTHFFIFCPVSSGYIFFLFGTSQSYFTPSSIISFFVSSSSKQWNFYNLLISFSAFFFCNRNR